MSDSSIDTDSPTGRKSSPTSVAVLWLMGCLGIYLGTFVLIVLDDLVFRTNFAMRFFPQIAPVARVVYYPLLVLAKLMGYLPDLPPVF